MKEALRRVICRAYLKLRRGRWAISAIAVTMLVWWLSPFDPFGIFGWPPLAGGQVSWAAGTG